MSGRPSSVGARPRHEFQLMSRAGRWALLEPRPLSRIRPSAHWPGGGCVSWFRLDSGS
jgi:hypothetical protein